MCALPEVEESILTYVLSYDLTDVLKNFSIIFFKSDRFGGIKTLLI